MDADLQLTVSTVAPDLFANYRAGPGPVLEDMLDPGTEAPSVSLERAIFEPELGHI